MRFSWKGMIRWCGIVAGVWTIAEIYFHLQSFDIQRPLQNLDEPFLSSEGCETKGNAAARRSGVIFMLARNSDLEDAVQAVRSLEEHFNSRYHYPYVFANNEPWTAEFKGAIDREVSGKASYDTIPSHMWGFRNGTPATVEAEARLNMFNMQSHGVPHAGEIEYHHMCRFHSGFFFDLPSLQPYDWYWRVEPDARFLCDIPYDPFDEMLAHNKTYGYVMALWEVGSTAPSLFRTIDDYRRTSLLQTGELWTSMHEASWAPLPLRSPIMSWLPSRNRWGDGWNLCHFWSNFEIASLAFFRSSQYRRLFDHLDSAGGFHLERWGDAAVHSLALALFLEPSDLHFFEDFGYRHTSFQHCPQGGIGCKCDCDPTIPPPDQFCFDRLRQSVATASAS